MLIERLNWSLYELDLTDIASLFPFVFHLAGTKKKKEKQVFADQVDWL